MKVLWVSDLPDPPLGPDAILVQVRATGVDPVGWNIRQAGGGDALTDAHRQVEDASRFVDG